MYLQTKQSEFNYSAIAKKYGDAVAEELKALEQEGHTVLHNAMVKLGKILLRGKNLVPYRSFSLWHTTVFGIGRQRVSEFMAIAQSVGYAPIEDILPNKLRPASVMAKAVINAPSQERGSLVEKLKEATNAKGKTLTEAEITEISKKYEPEKQKQLIEKQLNIAEVISLFPDEEVDITERKIQDTFGGEKEVTTPVGRIDVLTEDEIIEIKEVSQWKNAVGQILCYATYYPDHQKHIVLFGKCYEHLRIIINTICEKYNIKLTFN